MGQRCEGHPGEGVPHSFWGLKSYPKQAVTTAILIEGHRAVLAARNSKLVLATRLQVVATTLRGNPVKHSIVTFGMALWIAATLDMEHTILELHHREILAIFIRNGSGQKLVHSLATADNRGLSIDKLSDNIAAKIALVKFHVHSCIVLVTPHPSQKQRHTNPY